MWGEDEVGCLSGAAAWVLGFFSRVDGEWEGEKGYGEGGGVVAGEGCWRCTPSTYHVT